MTVDSSDVLTYLKELEQTGLSHEQSTAIAKGAVNVMEHRMETLVTKAHFDTEMAAMKSRFDGVDQRFEAVDQRFDMVSQRLDFVEKALQKLESLPAELKLHTWMLALITIVLVIPRLQEWFAR